MSEPQVLPTPTFPEKVSNTSRSTFVQCPQKWYWAYCLRGMRGKTVRGVDLVAGGAFAKGLETVRKAFYEQGIDAEAAIQLGVDAAADEYGDEPNDGHVKAKHRVLGAVYNYFDKYPLETDYLVPYKTAAGTGIEFKFAVPLPIQHPTLDQPLLYEGRVDLIAEHKDINGIWIVDEKTMTKLGPQWRRKWDLDAQPTSYIWAAQQHGYNVAGALIRGISFLSKGYGYEESLQPRSQFQIDDWYNQLLRDVRRMIYTFTNASATNAIEYERPDRALDKDACAAYSGCAFLQPCKAADPNPWLWQIFNPPENQTFDGADGHVDLMSLFD